MIGTLFAQEFRTTRRTLCTAVGILVLCTVVALAAAALRIPILGTLGIGGSTIAAVAVLPLVLGILAASYWRTMYGRQGYFTMTLPVHGRDLFTAKVLYALAASVAALVVAALILAGVGIAAALADGFGPFDIVRDVLVQLGTGIELVGVGVSVFFAGALLLQLVFIVVTGAALMSIGSEARFNHLGFGAPVIGAVITYFGMQVLGLAATLFIPLGIRVDGPDTGSFVAEGMLSGFVAAVSDPTGETQPGVLGVGIVLLSLVVTVLFAWRGARSVERRTSLR